MGFEIKAVQTVSMVELIPSNCFSAQSSLSRVCFYPFFSRNQKDSCCILPLFSTFSLQAAYAAGPLLESHTLFGFRETGENVSQPPTTSSRFPIPKFGKEQKMSSEGRMQSCLMTSTDEIHNSGEKSLANCLKTTSANKRLYSRSTAKHYLGAVESAPEGIVKYQFTNRNLLQSRKRTECRSVFPTASRYVAWSAYVRWKQGLLRVAESLRESWSPDAIAFYTLIKPFPPASH